MEVVYGGIWSPSFICFIIYTPSTSYPDQIRPALVKTWRKTRRSACLVFVAHAQNGLTARHPTWPWRARTARTASTARSSPSGCHILSETFQESCRNSRNSSIISIVSSKGKRLKQHRLTHTMNRYEKKIKEGGIVTRFAFQKPSLTTMRLLANGRIVHMLRDSPLQKSSLDRLGLPESYTLTANRHWHTVKWIVFSHGYWRSMELMYPPKHCITHNSKVHVKLFQDSTKNPQEWHESLGLLCTALFNIILCGNIT